MSCRSRPCRVRYSRQVCDVRGGVGDKGGEGKEGLSSIFLVLISSCDTEKHKSQLEEMEQEKAQLELLLVKYLQGEVYEV